MSSSHDTLGPKSWLIGWHWRERILKFEPSWFTAAMSTGFLQQCFVNFPYPITGAREWLRDIGYILWIIDVILVVVFLALLITRYIRHPILLKKNLLEFPQSSFMGAIPIAIDGVISGIVSFYDYRSSARWAAFVLWCIALVLTVLVSIGLITIQTIWANKQELDDVAGLWCMACVPSMTTAASGAALMPYLHNESHRCAILVLVISFMLWSLAMFEVTFILSIYLFRLIAFKLPGQALLASGFLPVAALSNAAFSAHQMSLFLGSLIRDGYAPTQGQPPPLPTATLDATAEAVHWLGILLSLGLLAHATFWLVQASTSVLYSMPKQFNISLWSLVFPWASYANAWAVLSRDLRNDGMRGWAAFNTAVVTILWIFCAGMTTYLGFWRGSLFSAPGLEEWLEQEDRKDEEKRRLRGGRLDQEDGTYELERPAADSPDEERGQAGARSDGHAVGLDEQLRGRRRR